MRQLLFFILLLVGLAGCVTAPKPARNISTVNPAHTHTVRLLKNALRYIDPKNGLVDPMSGYPFEGWNQQTNKGLYLRQFTQLTAIGERLELLANIAAGYADNPFILRGEARVQLARMAASLRHDQQDPEISAKGLLVNFIGFENLRRLAPLQEVIVKEKFIDAFGGETATNLWRALCAKGWLAPHHNDREADIRRRDNYGSKYFDGPLQPFAAPPRQSQIMALLDRRVVQIVFGDNANLSASVAKAIGALLRPEIKDDPDMAALRAELEIFLENQRPGYAHMFDEKTGTFMFGWDATRNRQFGWEDGAGNYTVGHMNYLVNEFRGPLMFVALRFGFPAAAIANTGFKIKPYRASDGHDIYTLATWDGSAFQSFGLTLFMQELKNPGWRKILKNTADIELDFAARHRLPGFLSEAYSGRGVEYTGRIGVPDIAIAGETRNTNAPSLYTLGAVSQVAPDEAEKFLAQNWPEVSRLFTRHGPWEGIDTTRRKIVKYQTTAHTLALILGGIQTAPENMRRYLEGKGLLENLRTWYAPGEAVDFLAKETQIIPWTSDGSKMFFSREDHSFHVEGRPLKNGFLTLSVLQPDGVNLSNGELVIRYRTRTPIDQALISINRVSDGLYGAPEFSNEIFLRFNDTGEDDSEIRVPFPATPGLARTKDIVIGFGKDGGPTMVDFSVTVFKFVPNLEQQVTE